MKRVAWRHNSQANILNFVLCASWIENDVRTASHESESTYGATDYARDVRDLDQGHRSQITTAFNFSVDRATGSSTCPLITNTRPINFNAPN